MLLKNTEIQIISRKIKLFFERVIFFELAPKNKNEIVHMYVEVLNVYGVNMFESEIKTFIKKYKKNINKTYLKEVSKLFDLFPLIFIKTNDIKIKKANAIKYSPILKPKR